MGCDEQTRIAFLEGTLDLAMAQDFDAHLLDCEACWVAVRQDRFGRHALAGLHEPAPPVLLHRIRLAVEAEAVLGLVPTDRPPTPVRSVPGRVRRPLALLAAAMLVAATFLLSRPVQHDPVVVAAVLRLARHQPLDASSPAPPAEGQRAVLAFLRFDGQEIEVARYRVEGHDLVVASADRDFPMPAGARALAAGEHAPWVTRRGELGVACFSRPVPLLVAGRLAPDRVAELATRIHSS